MTESPDVKTDYTHCGHIHPTMERPEGEVHLQWNGPWGEVRATRVSDGLTRVWPKSENTKGDCLLKAMRWWKDGYPVETTPPDKGDDMED